MHRLSVTVALTFALLLTVVPVVAIAQSDPVGDLQSQDEDFGAGCNEIAVALPPSPPLIPDQQWLEEHSACAGPDISANVTCSGEITGDVQIEACLFRFSAISDTFTLDCSAFVLLRKDGTYSGPALERTENWAALLKAEMERQNLSTSLAPTPCTVPTTLQEDTPILVVFEGQKTDSPFGLWVKFATNKTLGFVVNEPRQDSSTE